MDKEQRQQSTYLLIAVGIAAILWWSCIILVPAFPNTNCSSAGGSGCLGGGNGGGSASTNVTCPDPCARGTHFDTARNGCYENSPTTPIGIPCPVAQVTAAYCNCPTGYYWDTVSYLCIPSV